MGAVDQYTDALEIASRVVAEAAELLRGAQGAIGEIRSKSNERDLVTEWDVRCEELVVNRLSVLTPGVPVLAEEGGQHGGTVNRLCWVVDPIDGTVNFAHGVPMYSVCLSLEVDGQPVAAVVDAPAMGWTFAACRGDGATFNGKRMAVSRRRTLVESMLASGFPSDRQTTRHNFLQWEHFQCEAGACRRFGAASLDLCMVANGWLDGYWESRLAPWDLSAGALIVMEAGGSVTGINGDAFSSRSGHIVASNGVIHNEILAELAAVGTLPL